MSEATIIALAAAFVLAGQVWLKILERQEQAKVAAETKAEALRTRQAAEKAAATAAEAKVVLGMGLRVADASLVSLTKVAEDTLTHVNGGFGVLLRLNAELSRWKADRSDNPEFQRDAESAQKAYEQHKGQENMAHIRRQE